MKFADLQKIADAIAINSTGAAIAAIDDALENETGKGWIRELTKLADVIMTDSPRFTVIAKDGNSKLPFLAFSTLPGKGFCPGAGDCVQYCYSFRAWRYPAAFARQAQNSWLMHRNRPAILSALDACKPETGGVPFRLYVDGDFGDVTEVAFWMQALDKRLWLGAYGYSKSWEEFEAYAERGHGFPTNYKLNLSGGSKHSEALRAVMEKLPITRGNFKAVNVGHKVKASDHGDRAHQKELREVYGQKAFTCPGKCGECTPTGHACGSSRFDGVDIIIAVH